MVAEEVRPPTHRSHRTYVQHKEDLETGACKSGRVWIISRKEKKNRFGGGGELVLFLKKLFPIKLYPCS